MSAAVSSAPYAALSLTAQRSRLVWNRQDEAHLSVTAARKALLALWPNALRIGLTATPTRKDGRALGLLYDALIEPTTTAELTAQGYLVTARYFSVSKPDLKRVRTVAGDFHQGELETAMNQPRLVGDIVTHWLTHAATRRTVVFATSIAHSVALCEGFLSHGVAAEHVDADTPQPMREATFARFRDGRTQVLTNCFLASYGFDLPDLSCVVLARATKSLQLYLQMVGRGLRTADGKPNCLVLDHSGCVHQHGFAQDARVWTLDGVRALVEPQQSARERREAKMLECPECHCTFSGARLCPECSYFFAPRGREIKTLEGELVEIGEHLEPEQQDRAVFYAELRGVAAERNFKGGWAAHKFRDKFGDWPPYAWNNDPAATPSLETRRWVQSRFIAWRKARERTAAA
jgi:superfamily II DNA or RNA helicase